MSSSLQMLLRRGLRGGLKAFSKGFLSSHQVGLHDEASLSTRLLVQRVVPWLRTRDFSAADDKGEKFRKKLDELREIKRQMEELDKEYNSCFTVEYALEMAKKGFKDSDEDEPEDKPEDKPENLDPSPESSDSSDSSSESLDSYSDDLPYDDYDD